MQSQSTVNTISAPSSMGQVTLLSTMGNDIDIVNAARVSYNKEGRGDESDKKLIKYLMDHEHTTPFEMVRFKFLVEAPIAVARQLLRQRTASINEMSRRYTSENIRFMTPKYRMQHPKNKQASEDVYLENSDVYDTYEELMRANESFYNKLISLGVSREQARFHLPVSTMTKYIYLTDAHNLMRVIRLRISPDAQFETQEYAYAFLELIRPYIPWTIEFFEQKYNIDVSRFSKR